MRDDREKLRDILDAIEAIDRYASRGKAAFDADELFRGWVVLNLLNLGEACRALSEPLRDAHPEIPWRQIMNTRNILVHVYFGIDYEIVWSVVQNDLTPLKAQITSILRSLES